MYHGRGEGARRTDDVIQTQVNLPESLNRVPREPGARVRRPGCISPALAFVKMAYHKSAGVPESLTGRPPASAQKDDPTAVFAVGSKRVPAPTGAWHLSHAIAPRAVRGTSSPVLCLLFERPSSRLSRLLLCLSVGTCIAMSIGSWSIPNAAWLYRDPSAKARWAGW